MTRRVFLSHTSDFSTYPDKKSFVDAAVAAVIRAGCVLCDMEYFTARDQQPAQYCIDRVRDCDVYVGIIGLRYGSPVRDRPAVSYTELEFEAASEAPAKTRLIFLLAPNALVPAEAFTDTEFGDRQKHFRKRLSNAGIMCKLFTDFHELDKLIYQALKEEVPVAPGARQKLERIEWPKDKSPFPGLMWFNEDYAPLFFGRDRDVEAVLAKMREPQGRFLVISGASGSGKSSLVSAGLWQAVIHRGQLPGSERWRWKRVTPGAGKVGPFVRLAIGLQESFPQLTEEIDELASLLKHDAMAVGRRIASHLTDGVEFVLVVDQLEELFTHGYSAETIQAFLAALVMLSDDPQHRLRIVTTIRSEFIGRLAESESVLRQINDGFHYLVPPIAPTAWQEVIERPASLTGYTFEPRLVDTILNEVGLGKEPGNLPLVAYALNQLFEQRQGNTFTHAAYEAMGGVAGAIAATADQVMEKIGEGVSHSFDRVFAELMHLERDEPPTRKRVPLAVFQDDTDATQLIRKLAGRECRILVTGEVDQVPTVEVAHEKLFAVWPRLKKWVDKSREALGLIEHATEAAHRWRERERRLEWLWSGQQAKEALAAFQRFGKTLELDCEPFLKPQQMLIEQLDGNSLSHDSRLLIGRKLAEFGDPRAGVGLRPDGLPDIAWVEVPGGRVRLEESKQVFTVKPFRIAKYPVTNEQFEAFLKAEDGFGNEEWWGDIEQSHTREQSKWQDVNAPREQVSWYEAVAFGRWLSAKTGTSIRLPTEWEWQQAATGGDPQRQYPWPGAWDASRCNSYDSGVSRTTAVGMYPQGATAQGVFDMAGNVWEWCLNTHENPEQPEAVRIDKGGRRVVRGGSWLNLPEILRVSYRSWYDPGNRGNGIGFRLAQDLP